MSRLCNLGGNRAALQELGGEASEEAFHMMKHLQEPRRRSPADLIRALILQTQMMKMAPPAPDKIKE